MTQPVVFNHNMFYSLYIISILICF